MERFLQAPPVVFRFWGIPITETMIVSWGIMSLLLVVGFAATRNLRRRPRGLQTVLELFIEGFKSLLSLTMGSGYLGFLSYMGALTLFILLANVSGLLGVRPPTADINITMGLALLTFIMTQYYGAKAHGIGGYIKSLGEPFILLMPMNIVGELARPLSLGMRLFGNILGGSIIMGMIYDTFPAIIPVPFHVYFDLFVGALQTFIFVMLTMVFVRLAAE